VSGRFGGSVMFVSYSRFLRQWYWITPGSEEKIAQPQMLFLDPDWVVLHPSKTFVAREKPLRIKQPKTDQLLLNI
jgi:hypothetical protein